MRLGKILKHIGSTPVQIPPNVTAPYSTDTFNVVTTLSSVGSTSIANGMDFSTSDGLVFFKNRTTASPIELSAKINGTTLLATSLNAQLNSNSAFSYSSSGITDSYTSSGQKMVYWSFRACPKFLSIVSWTGNGQSTRKINHTLGVVPGTIFIKNTTTNDAMMMGNFKSGGYSVLSSNLPATNTNSPFSATIPTFNAFTVTNNANQNGSSYVAFVFAHDTNSDGIIQCGEYTGTGSSHLVDLGWEPQWLLVKNITGNGAYHVLDVDREFSVNNNLSIHANESASEYSSKLLELDSTGFRVTSSSSEVNSNGNTYSYIAIRRPNKESSNSIFHAVTLVGISGNSTISNSNNFDLQIHGVKNTIPLSLAVVDKTRGYTNPLTTNTSNAETTGYTYAGIVDQYVSSYVFKSYYSTRVYFQNNFKRAYKVFDIAVNTDTTTDIRHNLGVMPEIVITKIRNSSSNWILTYYGSTQKSIVLNSNAAWYNSSITSPTNTHFSVSNFGAGQPRVSYLFSSYSGVCKIGTYTGNGTNVTVNCGFTPRYVMIKRVDSTGDFNYWDYARGINAGNEPYLSLNTLNIETSNDSIDTTATSLIVNNISPTNMNVTGGTYLYLILA